MPEYMRLFSSSLHALYTDKAVGTSAEPAQRFRRLRDDTRQDAIIYFKGILPITTKFVMVLKDFFANYHALSYEEWCEMLPDIIEETTACKELAETVLKMHEDLLVPLKKRENDTKIILTEFKDLKNKYEEQKSELEASAKFKYKCGIVFLFIPVVNLVASPLLFSYAKEDTAKAIAKQAQAEIWGTAALTVTKALIPALSNFIKALTTAAAFFQVMEIELQSLIETADNTAYRKQLHYKRMKKEAEDLKALCQSFYAVLPAVRTDFAAIPSEDTDQNFVDIWLEKQLEAIVTKRGRVGKFVQTVLKQTGQMKAILHNPLGAISWNTTQWFKWVT